VGVDGKRIRSFFRQKKEATTFLDDKAVESENLGTAVASGLDDNVKREAFDAMTLLRPFGKSILDAAQFYHLHLEATAKSETLTQAYEDFLLAMGKSGKAKLYLDELRVRLLAFIGDKGDRMCASVSVREIAQWLNGLKVSNVTRNNYRRVVCTFFSWCVKMGYCPENPVAKIDKSKDEPNKIEIYTPREMGVILRAASGWRPTIDCPRKRGVLNNETRDILANMVICGFAGIRQAEFERLSWEQIKMDRNGIDLSAAITKTAARRIVRIQPVLKLWLEKLGIVGTGKICLPDHGKRLHAFREYLLSGHKIAWKHNALRHSFASYLMEKVQNPGEVSLQLGHSNTAIVFAHYRELVTTEDMEAYWALTPDMVQHGAPVIDFAGEKAVAS
jgi:integrase